MAWETRDNTGSAFKNQRKESEKHADYTGEAMVDGTMKWVNIWVKKDKNGNAWFSFSFRDKQSNGGNAGYKKENTKQEVVDDDIPF